MPLVQDSGLIVPFNQKRVGACPYLTARNHDFPGVFKAPEKVK